MSDKVQIYPPEGTLDQFSITCQGDEDVFVRSLQSRCVSRPEPRRLISGFPLNNLTLRKR